jgi:signal transduction histidine kinase
METGTVATGEDFFTVAVASAVHQLRTPLGVVAGLTELMTMRWEDDDREELRTMLDVVTRNVVRMGDLVEDLLALPSLCRDSPTVVMTDSDAATVLDAAADRARARGLAIEVRCPDALRLETDSRVVEQILATLVDNACEHGRPPVLITASSDTDQVSIVVTDAGPGVATRLVPELFQPFCSGVTSPRSAHGLGLYGARRSARRLQGDLYYVARPYGGTFVLTLPIVPNPFL